MAASIQLGGKERRVRYDLNALAVIGDKLGIKIRLAHIGEDLLKHPLPLSAIRTIIWAGVLHDSPDVTEGEVGGWVVTSGADANVVEVMEYFFDLFGETSPGLRATMENKVEGDMGLVARAS